MSRSPRKFSLVLVSGMMLLTLGGGCSSKDAGSPGASSGTPVAVETEQKVGEAGKAYVHFRKTLAEAKSLAEITPFLAAEKSQEIQGMGEQAEALLPVLQAAVRKDVEVKSEDIQGDRAVVSLSAKTSEAVGTATMVKEEGAWKLLEEEWEESDSSPSASATPES